MATTANFEVEGVEDLVLLPKVSEEGITENIRKRYMQDRIYTNIGPVLLSVNPFRHIPGLCDDAQIPEYQNRFRYEVPPNIFALAEEAYRQLKNNENQCVIITGESGAGKTEAAKLIMKYVAAVSGESAEINYVKNVIMDSNPLLESFGNAKTLRNNNSSRFGKYFEIQFDRLGNPIGGKINHYLLEKSRVVRQIKGERSFHVFYQFLLGASPAIRQSCQLGTPKDYNYLSQSGCFTVDGTDDLADYKEVIQSINTIGISESDQNNMWTMLGAVLTLGNIIFDESGETSSIKDTRITSTVSQILGCNANMLQKALISRLITTGMGSTAETYDVPNNKIQAEAARDSLAKMIYSRLFDYIVEKTNIALEKYHTKHSAILGVLDIYGFEIFENNGFEQFCINYVNEKLQQYFIELTLKAEQEEYKSENIQWTPIKFFNNKIVCDLIEGKSPPGLFSVLDDVCFTMHATESDTSDYKFVEKSSGIFSSNLNFQAFDGGFKIKHYAGDVSYKVRGFCDRNKDSMTNDLIETVQKSTNCLLVALFPEDISQKQTKRPTTAGFKIKSSAQALISELSLCIPHYIRTIKPNETKKPKDWDAQRVNHQVKYLGLLENVRVRRAGFAFRSPFERFLNRYKKLCDKTWGVGVQWTGDPAQGCRLILSSSALEEKQWQLGRTKVFIRHPESLFFLEESLERFDYERAAMIQKAWRNWKGKKKAMEDRIFAANLFRHKKERRRDSIQFNFDADYLNYDKNFPLQQAMSKYRDERLLFGNQVIKFSKRGCAERRDLVVTVKGLYLCRRARKNHQQVYKIDWETQLSQIRGISLSPYQDNIVIIHAQNDLLLDCERKAELVSVLMLQIEAVCHTKLILTFATSVNVNVDNKFSQSLNFNKEESSSQLKIRKEGNKFYISIATGLPSSTDAAQQSSTSGQSNQVRIPPGKGPKSGGTTASSGMSRNATTTPAHSQPSAPLPTFPPASAPKVTKCRALFDYRGDGENQLSFAAGDIITILQKDPAGWWEGELRGQNGWIPANYVEEI